MALTDIPTRQLPDALREGEEASASELLALAGSSDARIRAGVAARPDAPMSVLIHLAQDPKSSVREALAGNPAVASMGSVLGILTADPSADVLVALVENPAIPPLRVRILLDHGKRRVRQAVEARLLER